MADKLLLDSSALTNKLVFEPLIQYGVIDFDGTDDYVDFVLGL